MLEIPGVAAARKITSRSLTIGGVPDPSSSSGEETEDGSCGGYRVPLWLALLGMLASALLACGGTLAYRNSSPGLQQGHGGGPLRGQSGEIHMVQAATNGNPRDQESELGSCVPGKQAYRSVSSLGKGAQQAVKHAFQLVNHARKECLTGEVSSLPFGMEAFLTGEDNCHSVSVAQKWGEACGSESYLLDFRLSCPGGGNLTGSSLSVLVNRDLHSGAWVLLRSDPQVCSIDLGSAVAPLPMAVDQAMAQDTAEFAMGELADAMRREGCPLAGRNYSIHGVSAAAVVVDGVAWKLELDVKMSGMGKAGKLRLTVVDECLVENTCIKQLSLPPGGVCGALDELQVAAARRLDEGTDRQHFVQPAGNEAVDPTRVLDAQRHFLRKPRRLLEEREPLRLRHIREGAIPFSHSPVLESCFANFPAYDQGHCASCYAAAAAQMVGIRKCLYDSRRLRLRRLAVAGAAQRSGNESWRRLRLQHCRDEGLWQMTARGRQFNCQWFALHDPGCRRYPDHGQRTHCPLTCQTCTLGDISDYLSHYDNRYMVAITHVATCSKDASGMQRGCDGGGPEDIWNNWMKDEQRLLWLQAKNCMPNQLKCHETPGGVTNPLSGRTVCGELVDVPLWLQPCQCIQRSEVEKPVTCSAEEPPSECSHEVPPAFFIIKSVAHGLTPREASENMQRHILEFGPIMVAVVVTQEFTFWDFSQRPIYTGGREHLGGHVMLATGWGSLAGMDFWQIRNSWSARWAQGGYCKFQRGVNLDAIEERGVAASMPTANFKDWSEPVCSFEGVRWQWWKLGDGTVTNYTGFLDFLCDEDCSLALQVSEPSQPGGAGVQRQQAVTGGVKAVFTLNFLGMGFAYEGGEMHVGTRATDPAGNTQQLHISYYIPAAGG